MNIAAFGSLPLSACALGAQGSDGPDRISKNFYDAAGRVWQVKTALGIAGEEANEVTRTFTDNGLVKTVTDGENNKTTYEYDGLDRLEKTYFPVPNPKGADTSNGADYEQSTYESLAGGARTSNLVVAFRNRGNQTVNFGYDALGRQTSKDLPGTEPDVTYGYDLLGQLTSASQTGHALSFTYDALGRVLNQTGPLGTIASEWDLAGRRKKLTWPDGFFVTYDYLVTGETTAIRENGAASGIGVIGALTYDDLGRRKSLTLGNGVATQYTYDAVSRLNDLKLDFAGTTDDLTSTFAYNPASQIAGNLRSNDAYSWTGHGSGTTVATSNGVAQTANGLNQIGSWVSTLLYDAKGNLTVDGTYTYGYSSENLLTSLANSATGALQPTIAFSYDPLMRLAKIDSSNAAFDVDFGYDGQEMVLEGLSAGRTRRYVYGSGTDEPLVGYLVTSTGTSRLWYQADERGSIARLSNDAGTPGGIGKFDEYGQGGTGRFRYTGQYWLGEANLLYYRARIYDPRLGRFLQPDPIGYGDGMAMYAYVKGDPVNFNDPTGLELDGPDVIITGIRVNAPAEIIDSGAMGAASAGLRSVGGTVGAAPGGRPVGPAPKPKAKPKPKPKKKGPACPAPSNVSLTGTIVAAPAGPAYFSGTLKDVSTGRTYSVNGSGYGGGFIVGTYDVTGTVKGFDALSNGIDIVFAQGPYGTGGASFTDNNGRSIGEGSVDGAFAPPIGAGGVSIDPPVVAETDSGNC